MKKIGKFEFPKPQEFAIISMVNTSWADFLLWLADEELFSSHDLVEVVRRPHKWESEYRRYQESQQLGPHPVRCPECDSRSICAHADVVDWINGLTAYECECQDAFYLISESF